MWYYLIGGIMTSKNYDVFDKEQKYKLYRSVYDILHPTISKRNISDYKIIIDEDMASVRVFYPLKVSDISNVMIFVHGDGDVTGCNGCYNDICRNLALDNDHLIIAVDYDDFGKLKFDDLYDRIYEMVKYLYVKLNSCNISNDNIVLCGDSTGANIIISITRMLFDKDKINVNKEILFYPIISMDYFGKTKFESIEKYEQFNVGLMERLKLYLKNIKVKKSDLKKGILYPLYYDDYSNFPKTLIFTGNVDSLKDEAHEYYKRVSNNREDHSCVEIAFGTHGFLGGKDKEIIKEVNKQINKFLEN